MSTITLDGQTRVTWVALEDGIADLNAPTAEELTAGTDLQDHMTPDGLTVTPTTGSIDNSNLGSTFTTAQNGRRSFSSSVKVQQQTATADPLGGILLYDAAGFLCIRRGVAKATAWTASQEVEVYPMVCGEPSVPASAPEQIWTYEVPMMVTDDPVTRPPAIVAA
jgi:hypothetical protein